MTKNNSTKTVTIYKSDDAKTTYCIEEYNFEIEGKLIDCLPKIINWFKMLKNTLFKLK